MPRKVTFTENAKTFRDVDPDTIAAQDTELGEMVECAQLKLELTVHYESLKSDVYPARPLKPQAFWRGWKQVVYAWADATHVVCFSVAWLRPRKSDPLDPMQVIRRRLEG